MLRSMSIIQEPGSGYTCTNAALALAYNADMVVRAYYTCLESTLETCNLLLVLAGLTALLC